MAHAVIASGLMTHSVANAGNYAAGRSRLALHPSRAVLYMTGDGPSTTNVFVFGVGTGISFRGNVGDEASPGGIVLDATGTMLYTTSFAGPDGFVCYRAVEADGALPAASGYIATCGQPRELHLAATLSGTSAVVVCANGDVGVHPIDPAGIPGPVTLLPVASGIRGSAISSNGALYLATTNDEIVQLDGGTGGEVDRFVARAGTTALAVTPDGRHVLAGDAMGVVAYATLDYSIAATWDGGLGAAVTSLVLH
jgi:hypothetical protein